MRGLVTINKVFDDGRQERVIQEECNVLTDGFSMSIVSCMAGAPSNLAKNLQFKYFQVGTGAYYDYVDVDETNTDITQFAQALPQSTHNNFYELSSALPTKEDYGTQGNLKVVEKQVLTVTNPFQPQEDLNYTTSSMFLVELERNPATKLNDRSINVKFNIDKDSINDKSIKEFGLFVENPEFKDIERPVLAAYKQLPIAIDKTSEFSLSVEWAILLDNNPETIGVDFPIHGYEIKKLGEVLTFYPSVKQGLPNKQYSQSIDVGQTYDVIIESYTPTPKDGYLTYSLGGDAVSGVHYNIAASSQSPIFWPKGSTRKIITVSSIDSNLFRDQGMNLEITMSSFTGGKRIPDLATDYIPNKFYILFSDTQNTPPSFEMGTSATTGDSMYFLSALLNEECLSDVEVYLQVSSTNNLVRIEDVSGNYLASGNTKFVIPRGDTSGGVYVSGPAGDDVIVSAYNTVSAVSFTPYNVFAHSNDYRPEEQANISISIKDIQDNSGILIEGGNPTDAIPEWYLQNVQSGGRVRWAAYPTTKTHSGWDLYVNNPTQDLFINTVFLDDIKAPDGVQNATLAYAPSAIYIWPGKQSTGANPTYGPVNSPPKIRRSYSVDVYDQIGRRVERPGQRFPFRSDMSSVVFSTYAYKLGENVSALNPSYGTEVVDSCSSFKMMIYSRGFQDTGDALAPGVAAKGAEAFFSWNSNGGLDLQSSAGTGVFNGILSAGVFSGTSDDITKYGVSDKWAGNGWYRAFVSIEVPIEATELAPNGNLNVPLSGSTSQFFIIPTTQENNQMPGYTGTMEEAPAVLSGTVMAFSQYEEVLTTDTHNGYVPREYQPRESDYWQPIGNAYLTDDTAKQKFTFEF